MKFICFIIMLELLFVPAKAQDSIQFRMHYLPLHQYYETVVQKFKIVTSYAGDDSIMEILKEKGINNPDTNNIEQNLKANITTGNYNSANKMPVQLVYL